MLTTISSYGQVLNIYTKGANFPIATMDIDSILCVPTMPEESFDVRAILESSEEGWFFWDSNYFNQWQFINGKLVWKRGRDSDEFNSQYATLPCKGFYSNNTNSFFITIQGKLWGTTVMNYKVIGYEAGHLVLHSSDKNSILNLYKYDRKTRDDIFELDKHWDQQHSYQYSFVDETNNYISIFPLSYYNLSFIDPELIVTFNESTLVLINNEGHYKVVEMPLFKYNQGEFQSLDGQYKVARQWPIALYNFYSTNLKSSLSIPHCCPKVQEIFAELDELCIYSGYSHGLKNSILFGESGDSNQDGIVLYFSANTNMSVRSSYNNYCNSFVIESDKDNDGNYIYSKNFDNLFNRGMKETFDSLIDLLQGEFTKSQNVENNLYTLTSKTNPDIYFTWQIDY